MTSFHPNGGKAQIVALQKELALSSFRAVVKACVFTEADRIKHCQAATIFALLLQQETQKLSVKLYNGSVVWIRLAC